RVLPAGAVGRLRRAVLLRRGRPGPGHRPAAPERRVSQASYAGWASMREALHAEWTKLRTAPGMIWLLVAVMAFTVALSAAAAVGVTCPSMSCGQDPAKISLTGIELSQVIVAVLAVLVIGGEYSTGMIRTTLAAMPRRTTVLAAKAAILTGLVLAAGAVAVL